MPISCIEYYDGDASQWLRWIRPTNETGIRFVGAGRYGTIEVMYAAIPGGSWNQSRLNKFTAKAQDEIDYRIPLSDPSLIDDPAGPNGSDPARPDFFWDNGDLVSRSIIISDVTYTDRLNFTLTRAR